MYKKILFYLMLVSTLLRITSILLFNLSGVSHLPMSVTLLSGALAVVGCVLVIRTVKHGLRLKELTIFHCSEIALTCASFAILHFSPLDISIFETLITGNILTIVLDATFLLLAYRKKRYITIANTEKTTVRTLDRKKKKAQEEHPKASLSQKPERKPKKQHAKKR